tara:strand:+ start:240 stop:344 length:105 start_codon:yes stop_codon:yes gene_type:complete
VLLTPIGLVLGMVWAVGVCMPVVTVECNLAGTLL